MGKIPTDTQAIKRRVRRRKLVEAVRQERWALGVAALAGAVAAAAILLGPINTYRVPQFVLVINGHQVTVDSFVLEPEKLGGLIVLPSLIYPLIAFLAPFPPALVKVLQSGLEEPDPFDYRQVMYTVLEQTWARQEIDEERYTAKYARVRGWQSKPTDEEIQLVLAEWYKPGQTVPQSGQYKNTLRTGEITCVEGKRFPPGPGGGLWMPGCPTKYNR